MKVGEGKNGVGDELGGETGSLEPVLVVTDAKLEAAEGGLETGAELDEGGSSLGGRVAGERGENNGDLEVAEDGRVVREEIEEVLEKWAV